MSFTNPKNNTITRWSVVGMEGMYAKMFDPPKDNPLTPDLLAPTNPVPEVMAVAGYQTAPQVPHTLSLDLMHSVPKPTWDNRNKGMTFFLFNNTDLLFPKAADQYPSATVRVPQGVIFHCTTQGKGPPPHTIHWHGIEPTTMNDGVGHCSMELGDYTYQWQPQFVGSYFAHCHRNTMQHFEFGLFFLLLIEPRDTYFATQVLGVPIGHCRDGKRRIAANVGAFPQFPSFNANSFTTPDPWTGDPRLKFATDPHANTVAYDVEALWVLDDRDSAWSDLANNPRQTYPVQGTRPGFNDNFHSHAGSVPGANDFFAFNDYNADYWYVTGVAVPAHKGGTGTIAANVVIPPGLNSGVTGSQVSINAPVGQTILVRCLDAAYNSAEVTFPMDVVVTAWDGRALGVEPFGHNNAYLVPAGTPIKQTTARRFDALIRTTSAMVGTQYATVKFINTRGQMPNVPGVTGYDHEVVCTALIPITVTAITVPSGSLVINGGANVTTSLSVTLSLTATAASGSVTQMQFTKDGGLSYTAFETFQTTRVVSLLPGNGPKTIGVRFKDSGGNISNLISGSITLTAVAPVGSVSINAGAATTTSLTATLTLAASSPTGTVVQMQFSKDGGATYTAFEPFAVTRTVTLPPGNGTKTITVRFKDSVGNVSAPVSDSIILGAVVPSGTILINNGATSTASLSVTLTLAASSASGSITQMQFSKDGGATYTPLEAFATTRIVTLLPGNGPKTITVRYLDSVGNVSVPVSAGINLTAPLPVGTVLINGGQSTTGALTVALTLSASSAAGSITQMQFSKDGGVSYFPLETFATSRTVSLLPGDGPKTITVRFKDSAGNISAPVSASITLTTPLPTGTISFLAGSSTTSATAVLALSANSNAGAVTLMQFSKDGGTTYFALEPFATTRTVTLVPGSNTLTVRFKDVAGKLSNPVSASITRI
jgi:hypothetical protein